MGMKVEFVFNKSTEMILDGAGINKALLLTAADEARELMHGYVPMDTGALANSAVVFMSADGNRGVVSYTQPYAAYCYYGGHLNFRKDKNPGASAYWDRAMLAAQPGVLCKNIERVLKGR